MGTLFVVFVLSLTAVSVISLGIMLAYGAVVGVLKAFAFSQSHARLAPKLVLLASPNQSSGD